MNDYVDVDVNDYVDVDEFPSTTSVIWKHQPDMSMSQSTPHNPAEQLSLCYRQPASKWVEALPLGNGRLGAMVFGGVSHEHLQLNEDTLWSGGPIDLLTGNNPEALQALPEMRRLLLAGQYAEADALSHKMQGPFNQSYQPMGDLHVQFDDVAGAGAVTDYRRELNLDSAIASVRYTHNGATFTREVWVSAPDQVLVMRLSCDQPGRLNFTASLSTALRQLKNEVASADANRLTLLGQCPNNVLPSYRNDADAVRYAEAAEGQPAGITFAMQLHAAAEGGRVSRIDNGLRVEHADAVTLYLTAATSFDGYDRAPDPQKKDPHAISLATLSAAIARPVAELRQAHIVDHQQLFRRVALNLGTTPAL